eukprot:gene9189-10780_t
MIDLRHYSAPKNPIRISLVESISGSVPCSVIRLHKAFASEPLVTVLRFSGEPAPGSRVTGP